MWVKDLQALELDEQTAYQGLVLIRLPHMLLALGPRVPSMPGTALPCMLCVLSCCWTMCSGGNATWQQLLLA